MEDNLELEDITLSDIEYDGKSLEEYESLFTIILPKLPCTQYEIQNKIVDCANAYQKAYNIYNTLQVMCSKAEGAYKAEKYRLVTNYIESCTKRGIKPPGKDAIEAIVTNNESNTKLRAMMERYKVYNVIKDYFDGHRRKLETTLETIRTLNYSVSQSTKVEYKGNI